VRRFPASLALDRVHQGTAFAADESSGTLFYLDMKAEAGTQDIVAQ
jgi:hypothetical protein